MHPEIIRDVPGSCPICGMALEPKTSLPEEEKNPELVSMTWRFQLSLVLTIPVVITTMSVYIPWVSLKNIISEDVLKWMEFLLATPVVLWGGWPFFVRGVQSLTNRSPNMFTLIGLGVSVAYVYSFIALLFPGIFPVSFRSESGEVAAYFEAAAVIVTLVLLGQVLELKARSRTGAAIKALLGLSEQAENMRSDGQTVMFTAVDRKIAGLIGVADPVKETTPEAIQKLHAEGVTLVMLTGDSRTTANAVTKKLGIDEVVAEVLPDQKAEVVKRLQLEGRIVAMAGDGINDAPALAQAHVGIAMGTGTDVAMQSAGVTLVKGDLRGIVRARLLSKLTMGNIKQNLFFAFGYNALGVPVAAGILYPFFGILLSPVFAAAAMSFSSVSVVSNALRLRRVKL